jgi:hypothetical protein
MMNDLARLDRNCVGRQGRGVDRSLDEWLRRFESVRLTVVET